MAFRELHEKFIRNSAKRLDDIEHQLELLTANPADSAALDDAMRKLHGLAGLGTTFGFPEVTRLARSAENEAQLLLDRKAPADREHIARWREIVVQLRAAFVAGGMPDTPSWQTTAAALPPAVPIDVMLLEDDPIGHRIVARVLEKQGFQIRGAFTKAEALALLAARLPDAVISDILVPDGSGYEVIEHLRSLPGGDLPPAIITSGLQGFLDRVEAVRSGADAFFEKPIDFGELVRTLENLLERSKVESPRILAVEEDEEDTDFIGSVLEPAGYVVRFCTDAKRFESELAAFRPDLIILDTTLSGVNGYELAGYVRQKPGFTTTPIVFLSSEGEASARIQSVRAGADDHLTHPVHPGLLLATVTARIERARFLRNLVDHDGLTGLLTHSAFMRQLKIIWTERQRHPEKQPSLIMLDLDHFKRVNDTYGHPVGDRVLAALGSQLRKRLRRSDTLARYGGEEFAILLQDLNATEAQRLVDRLREEFGAIEHQDDAGTGFRATFSAGVAGLTSDVTMPEEWMAAADKALYEAKRAGRNRVVIGAAG